MYIAPGEGQTAAKAQGFFMRTAKALIRLGECPGFSESSLGAQVILLLRLNFKKSFGTIIELRRVKTCLHG